MKKNLLDKAAIDDMITRAHSLQVSSQPKWGVMNVVEMLHHCNLANRQILDGDMPYSPSTLKQQLLKILSLYIVPQFPKNMKGAARNDTKGRITLDQFDTEKRLFVETILAFGKHQSSIDLTHPAFGNLTTRQWGKAAWMHMDHHLRQFGV